MPLLFLVYINHLTDNIFFQMRLFAGDSSLLIRVEGVDLTPEKLFKDLQTITNWVYQWKMVFNPDITKQAIDDFFSDEERCLSGAFIQWYTCVP